ncbi:MAG TPA: hypothetical protein VGI66_10630 [Streptosporangiaceae bacterium]
MFSEAASGTQFLEIEPNGNLFISGPNAAYFSSIAGVSFPLTS